MKRLAIIGARGYVGAELLRLLDGHPGFELALVGSRKLAGEPVNAYFEHSSDLVMQDLTAEAAAQLDIDAWVLALPNGLSEPWVAEIDAAAPIVDLSADHRFVDDWTYGLTERNREAIAATTRLSNPGCYATGSQLAIAPILPFVVGRPTIFGVSGYSGAGTNPSEKNDPEVLRDNLLPYKLTGHTHEREMSRHLGHEVSFMPHVASFFRGIALTITADVRAGVTEEDLTASYRMWDDEPLVQFGVDAPRVRDNVGKHHVHIGGLTFDPERRRVVVVATIDNLLKGAATQALQNLNLMCGYRELEGIQ